jgi:hypothetical protein
VFVFELFIKSFSQVTMQKQNGTPKESSWKLNEPDSANDFSLLFDDRRPQENIFSPSKSGSKKRRLS